MDALLWKNRNTDFPYNIKPLLERSSPKDIERWEQFVKTERNTKEAEDAMGCTFGTLNHVLEAQTSSSDPELRPPHPQKNHNPRMLTTKLRIVEVPNRYDRYCLYCYALGHGCIRSPQTHYGSIARNRY